MDSLFSKKHLLIALRQSGLPCTYMTLLKYERKGIIDQPQHMQMMNGKQWRFYTEEEIEQNIEKIRTYKLP